MTLMDTIQCFQCAQWFQQSVWTPAANCAILATMAPGVGKALAGRGPGTRRASRAERAKGL